MKCFVVGGAVRDQLLGVEPKDFDYVVVGATPDDMVALGLKQVGADFPVFIDDQGVEYALARTERKSGSGYNGFVTDHSKKVTLEDDLMRRDLTINAMARSEAGELFDPFGGQVDIKNKTLRHVSDAFSDDPVRVLRVARFRARLGPDWAVDTDTWNLMLEMTLSGELNHLTRERVVKEMEKAFGEPHYWLFFQTLSQLNALEVVMPELANSSFDCRTCVVGRKRGSVAFQYAKVANSMDTETMKQFEARLNISNEWRKVSKMFSTAEQSRALDMVDQLYAMDAYRLASAWEKLIDDLETEGFTDGAFYNKLVEVWRATKGISFADLSDEEAATLKGKDIAAAIKQKRKEVAC